LLASDLVEIGTELGHELEAQAGGQADDRDGAVERWMAAASRFPFGFSEVRQATLHAGEQLGDVIQALLERIVEPPRSGRRRAASGEISMLSERLAPLVAAKRVVKSHCFTESRSGVSRQVDYFANSTTNTALDIVKLTAAADRDVRARGDAAAFKLEDIFEANRVSIHVFCAVLPDLDDRPAVADALTSIGSVGAIVHTDAAEAAQIFQSLVLGPGLLSD